MLSDSSVFRPLTAKTDMRSLPMGTRVRKLCLRVKYVSFLDERKREETREAIDNKGAANLSDIEANFWEQLKSSRLEPSSEEFCSKDHLKREFVF